MSSIHWRKLVAILVLYAILLTRDSQHLRNINTYLQATDPDDTIGCKQVIYRFATELNKSDPRSIQPSVQCPTPQSVRLFTRLLHKQSSPRHSDPYRSPRRSHDRSRSFSRLYNIGEAYARHVGLYRGGSGISMSNLPILAPRKRAREEQDTQPSHDAGLCSDNCRDQSSYKPFGNTRRKLNNHLSTQVSPLTTSTPIVRELHTATARTDVTAPSTPSPDASIDYPNPAGSPTPDSPIRKTPPIDTTILANVAKHAAALPTSVFTDPPSSTIVSPRRPDSQEEDAAPSASESEIERSLPVPSPSPHSIVTSRATSSNTSPCPRSDIHLGSNLPPDLHLEATVAVQPALLELARSTTLLHSPFILGDKVHEPAVHQIRDNFYQQLAQLQVEVRVKNNLVIQRFTTEEATEITNFFFDDMTGPKALERLCGLITEYTAPSDAGMTPSIVAKAETLAQDTDMPMCFREFYDYLARSSMYSFRSRSALETFRWTESNLTLLEKYLDLITKIDERDPSLISKIQASGFHTGRGVDWRTCTLRFLASSLGWSPNPLRVRCTQTQGVALIVQHFGVGITTVLPPFTLSKYVLIHISATHYHD